MVKSDEATGYLPGGKYMGKHLFYSYKTCESTDFWTPEFQAHDACGNMLSEDNCKGGCLWTSQGCVTKELAEGLCEKPLLEESGAVPLRPCMALLALFGATSAVTM